MKADIHPKYFEKAKVSCVCGNTFEIGSTHETITVEICSNCHPFWTGSQKFADIEGRVDKFKKKQASAEKEREKRIKAVKEKIQKQKERETAPQTIKEMLKALG